MPFGQPPPHRQGRRQKSIHRAFRGYDVLSTAQLMEFAFPRVDVRHQPHWRWHDVRQIAERFAVRVEPRTRPLLWRAKPGVNLR
jgi:hypothetical protein